MLSSDELLGFALIYAFTAR